MGPQGKQDIADVGVVIGVDPGPVNSGAAAVERVDGRWALVWTWEPGELIALPHGAITAAVEGLYVGEARQGAIAVAEDAGRWLERLNGLRILRPMASTWRADLLRLPPTTRAGDCDRAARALVDSLWPGRIQSGHVADAACIALWAAGVRGRARR
jgi:hypothetical protein